MKAQREHRVPLSARAIEIIRNMMASKQNDYVFYGDRRETLSDMSLLMLLRRMGRDDITTHGFRSTFRDWVAEETDYPSAIAEMALAHRVKNAVEAAYRRGDLLDKRRPLMADWGNYCAASPETTGCNVTQLRVAK
jgi:integrase